MKTKRSWLIWFAPLVAAVPLSLMDCGGSTSNPGSSGASGGGSGTTAGTGAGSGTTAGTGATTGTAGGTGATTGTAGGTGATTGTTGGTGATTGTTGGTSGGDAGGANPCTDGTYLCFGGQLCDPAVGCVQCLTNANCPPAGAGNATLKVCVLGSCEVCGANTDCAAGQVCYPSNHTCHASCDVDGGPTCAGTAGGGGRTPICDTTTGACVGCVTATDCANSPRGAVCDPTTQQCVQCAVNADCKGAAGGAVCDTASSTCVACLADTDCPTARPICEIVGAVHTCRAGCTTNANCAGRGVGGGGTPICDVPTGLCVECTMASQCMGAGAACTNNLCVNTQCMGDADCNPDGGSATPYCLGTRCVQCVNRAECPATSVACLNNVCR
jgi:hypothetical protein